MQHVFRRQSGVYVFRLAVPVQLRAVFGKTKIIEPTGTREITMAKIGARSQATLWRQRFFEARRLLSNTGQSNIGYPEIL